MIGRQAKSCATFVLLACCPCASALNPSLDINQYAHTAWTVRDGVFRGIISSIAQTPDGYLWLGTEFGLLRFDGIRSVPWQPPAGEHLPSSLLTSLLAGKDGRLWIGTNKGLASWKDGKLAHYPQLSGQGIQAILEDREGTVWVGGFGVPTARLCAIRDGSAQCYGEDGSLGHVVNTTYEDRRGNLWVGTATGLWRWKPGPPRLYPLSNPEPGIFALNEDDDSNLLIATRDGIRKSADGKPQAYPLPASGRQFEPKRLLRDRNGGLWIGTLAQGLLHVHQGKTDSFARSDGLSGNSISSLFEDRESNLWVASLDGGLDRFRDFAVPTVSLNQGSANSAAWSVLGARNGGVWLGTRDGLKRWNDGQITVYRKESSGLPDAWAESLFENDRGRLWISTQRGIVYFENGRFVPVSGVPTGLVLSIAGAREGNLWISHEKALFHLLEGRVVEQIPWANLGKGFALDVLPDSQGGLWLGFYGGGVVYFKDGQVRASYADTGGLGKGQVPGLQLDPDGTLWAATEGGLSRIKDGRVATLTSRNGLPCDTVHWVMEDDDHSVWLYSVCGLVRIARTELEAWATDPTRTIQATVFDTSDGVSSHSVISGYGPRVAKATDGKLWFVSYVGGVQVVDPRHLPVNRLPPPIHIEQVKADGKIYDASRGLRLPALARDVSIDFTALSFVAPERVRFRYKLEGQDPDWKEAANVRHAQYSNLAPRSYRFRVVASNNSGVWNETGDSLEFSIAPAYYQTNWFRASLVAAFLVLLWGLHRLRLLQVAREFNMRLEARVEERTRIARDLHDTLLQSFHGMLLRFQAAINMLPAQPEDAKREFEEVIDLAEQAIVEGRDAVQSLRSSITQKNELAEALTALYQELKASGSISAFDLTIEGASRNLQPIVREEVYRISAEALRNAFRHSEAQRIEVIIRYGERNLELLVRDDGKGIDQNVVNELARAGHWGLPGMRERAELIGGKLNVWSAPSKGTAIELSIPASIAYSADSKAQQMP